MRHFRKPISKRRWKRLRWRIERLTEAAEIMAGLRSAYSLVDSIRPTRKFQKGTAGIRAIDELFPDAVEAKPRKED